MGKPQRVRKRGQGATSHREGACASLPTRKCSRGQHLSPPFPWPISQFSWFSHEANPMEPQPQKLWTEGLSHHSLGCSAGGCHCSRAPSLGSPLGVRGPLLGCLGQSQPPLPSCRGHRCSVPRTPQHRLHQPFCSGQDVARTCIGYDMSQGACSGTCQGLSLSAGGTPDSMRPTIFPLPGRRVDDTKQLITGDSLWVQVHCHRLPLHVLVGLVEGFEDLRMGSIH